MGGEDLVVERRVVEGKKLVKKSGGGGSFAEGVWRGRWRIIGGKGF